MKGGRIPKGRGSPGATISNKAVSVGLPEKRRWSKDPREGTEFSRWVGEGSGTPLQHSCLENPTAGGAWWAAVHGVAKSQTRLSDFAFTFHFYALEKAMAAHSSVPAWGIPGTGSHRVGHDWSDSAAAAAYGGKTTPGSGSSQSKEPQKVAYLAHLRTSKGTLTWSRELYKWGHGRTGVGGEADHIRPCKSLWELWLLLRVKWEVIIGVLFANES